MAWLLLLAALCLLVFAVLSALAIGAHTERKDAGAVRAGLIFGTICLIASVALLLSAGIMFGRA